MQLGMIGLGRMGASMVRRPLRKDHVCVVHDWKAGAAEVLLSTGAVAATSLAELGARLSKPRAIWLMLPAGVVDPVIDALTAHLDPGNIVIDGGNSHYHDDIRRAKRLIPSGVHYVDVGTSGGVAGQERGYCLMIGGEVAIVEHLKPIFSALAPGVDAAGRTPGRTGGSDDAEQGFMNCGTHGAGHFVRMVHNGIEYAVMAALPAIAEVWRRGSVIGSRLLDLIALALLKDPQLAGYGGRVADSGEGRWTIEAAIDEAVPTHVLSAALYDRFASRGQGDVADRLLSAMRHEFGGHVERKG